MTHRFHIAYYNAMSHTLSAAATNAHRLSSNAAYNPDGNLGQVNTGKEKDYESGFHYYGARYYWSELLSGWLSVDPMADKYPSISPYAKLMDMDGRDSI